MAEEQISRDFAPKAPEGTEPGSKKGKGKARYLYFAGVAAIFFVVGFLFSSMAGITGLTIGTGAGITEEQAEAMISDYVKTVTGLDTEIKETSEEFGLYKIVFSIGDQEYTSYISKDGTTLFPYGIDLSEFEDMKGQINNQPDQPAEQPETGIPKSDRPEAHAFVMSYCPYGMQFLKAYISVMELLGGSADLEVNFVDYAMHGKKEIDDNTRMHCIQKEQSNRFTDYLRCFIENNGDYDKCLADAKIDETKLESCISATDKEFRITELYEDESTWVGSSCPDPPYCFPRYPVDAALDSEFGVGGSPTFVINGKTVSVNRAADAVKEAVCSAFSSPPEECGQTLRTGAEAPGFGPMGAGSAGSTDSATCG